MNASDILTALRADGLALTADGNRIRIEPGDRLTDEASELLRAHKAEVLALLRTADSEPAPVTDDERERLTSWLGWLGEDDPAIIAAFWRQVERDPEAKRYFLGLAGALVRPDDRRDCPECGNLRGGVCTAATRIGAQAGYRPLHDTPRRCRAFKGTP